MNDQVLIDYATTHCQTERALFHRDHIIRLYKLADVTIWEEYLPQFISWHENEALPILNRAKKELKKLEEVSWIMKS
jgi:hypothetical protein